jgi:hypothetical protein
VGKRAVVGLLLAAILGAGFAAPAGAATTKTALIYGDSLVWESTPDINLGTGWTRAMHAIFGRAPCDWLNALPADLATYHPTVVTIATAGNTQGDGSCETATAGSPEYFADYQTGLEALVSQITATSAQLVFVEDPPFADPTRNSDVVQINAMEVALSQKYAHVTVAKGIRKQMSTTAGAYKDHAKCLLVETAAEGCVAGLIPIRTLPGFVGAGLHLCPDGAGPALPACDEYSSGEVRFGKAIVTATKFPHPVLP